MPGICLWTTQSGGDGAIIVSDRREITVLELGIEPYDRAWEMQHRLVAARRAGRVGDVMLLLEHEPVLTLGRRADESNILAPPETLAALGVAVRRVERGGDVTYHGPGQLVGYPILALHDYDMGASDYMHALEEVLIRALAQVEVRAFRRDGLIGVWTEAGKIAALGVRIDRGITYHGFALNVDPIMAHWALIVPCGLTGVSVASVRQMRGEAVPMAEMRRLVRQEMAAVFGVTLRDLPDGDVAGWLDRVAPPVEER